MFLRSPDLERAVLKVVETDNQVVIVLRSEPDEHLTLHREATGSLLLTHWSRQKPPGTWDGLRAEAAQSAGYRDASRHAKYLTHRRLVPVQGMDGYELCERRVSLEAAVPKAKYGRAPHIVIEVPASEVMLSFHLARPEQPYSASEDPHVATALGNLYVRASFREWPRL